MLPSIRNSPRWVLYHGEVTAPFQGGSQEDENRSSGGRREKFGRFAPSEKEASDGGHQGSQQNEEEEGEDENEDEEDQVLHTLLLVVFFVRYFTFGLHDF